MPAQATFIEGADSNPGALFIGDHAFAGAPANPAADPDGALDALRSHEGSALIWSGTVAAGYFERDPASWLPTGRDGFNAFTERAKELLTETGARALVRPHCRHVLGDPQTCLTWIRALGEGSPLGLVLDPVAMLEPDMLAKADDHLARAIVSLAPHADAVLLSGAAVENDAVVRAPLSAGVGAVSGDRLAEMAADAGARAVAEWSPAPTGATP